MISKKKNKVRGYTRPNFKTGCVATVTDTVWYWHKDRYTNQRKKRQNQVYTNMVK